MRPFPDEMTPNLENVELLRKAYREFSHGRFPLDHLDPEVVWDESRRQVDPAVHQGHEGARRVFESRFEVFEDFRVEAEQFSIWATECWCSHAFEAGAREAAPAWSRWESSNRRPEHDLGGAGALRARLEKLTRCIRVT